MPCILIIEDDTTFSLMLSTWLKKKNFVVKAVSSVSCAKQEIEEGSYDLLLSDFRLPDGDGIDILKWLKETGRSLPLIMMTGYADIQTAVQSMKLGASDYISKPINQDGLLLKINEFLAASKAQRSPASFPEGHIEGQSAVAGQMYEYIRLVAPTDMSVLITGSSGTGKELVARYIHELSSRKKAPFIAVDCGAIPKDLAVSEFFGHIKGSFTGAIDNKTGAFQTAHGGTIFLDEIGNLTYEVQVQLLRALQEHKVKPIGSNHEIKTDIRLVSATNENLQTAIKNGDFREDLYHRINEFAIRIPDLKERKEDIMLFAHHFLRLANTSLQKDIAGFTRETIDFFQSYPWPGNVRQMKNAVKYATLLATERYITLKDLPGDMMPAPSVFTEGATLRNEAHEKELIQKALTESGNNKTTAARILGIDRKTLYNKLKHYGLS
ncbi:MAG: sigma-54 dependent transcriptional regulator [Tannerellaceae bacterium]|jgi:two-component system response regulator HydG|nr:sigma-54 dependent transcriptional regulator [Tannerellaceae bacterium]